MKIDEIPTADLERMLRVNERATDADPYAIEVLKKELDRRLAAQSREANPCD